MRRSGNSILCCLLLGSSALAAVDPATASLPIQQLLSKADALLASGQGNSALELYDVVLERDPTNYLSLYKRATAKSALGNLRKALEDYEEVLKLTEFSQARLQVAKLSLKIGSYHQAQAALETYLKSSPADEATKSLQTAIFEASQAASLAEKHAASGKWEDCISSATLAIERAPNNYELRRTRADCYLSFGHLEEGVGELNRAASLSPLGAPLLLRLSLLSYLYLGQSASEALSGIRQCLHSDPESKPCLSAHRKLKALEKDVSKARNFFEGSQWRQAADVMDKGGLIQKVRETITSYAGEMALPSEGVTSSLLKTLLSWTCRSLVRVNAIKSSEVWCEELYKLDPEDMDALVGKAESLLKKSEFEEAERLLKEAFEKSGRSSQDIRDRLVKAQKSLKQSKAKDYYKILGVSRDADEPTIKRAYRKATLKAHPDKPGGSEKAMAALNEAYEVLSNPELRARFDAGEDPNDHSTSQHGHPFGGGFPAGAAFFQQGGPFHQGGGGQTFHFQWGN